jgi:hypothetical protein
MAASLLVTVRPGSFEFPAIHFLRPQRRGDFRRRKWAAQIRVNFWDR